MERRTFFQLLGLGAGAAALGGKAVAAATIISNKEKTDAVKKIEEHSGYGKVTISANYDETAYPKGANGGTGYISAPQTQFVHGTRKHVTASLTVGPDGEMYLNTNGKWRRIVTE